MDMMGNSMMTQNSSLGNGKDKAVTKKGKLDRIHFRRKKIQI